MGDPKDIKQLMAKIQQQMDELYQNRVGGAMLGDVFGVGNGYKRSLFTGIAKYRTTQRDTKDLLWNRLKN
jgi:hypothetical protein